MVKWPQFLRTLFLQLCHFIICFPSSLPSASSLLLVDLSYPLVTKKSHFNSTIFGMVQSYTANYMSENRLLENNTYSRMLLLADNVHVRMETILEVGK